MSETETNETEGMEEAVEVAMETLGSWWQQNKAKYLGGKS